MKQNWTIVESFEAGLALSSWGEGGGHIAGSAEGEDQDCWSSEGWSRVSALLSHVSWCPQSWSGISNLLWRRDPTYAGPGDNGHLNIWRQFSTNIYNEFPSRHTTNFGSTSTSFLHKTVLIDSIIDKLFDTLSIVILITFQSALQHLCQPSSQQPAPVPHSTCRKLYISVQFIVFRDRAHRARAHQPGGHGEFPTITHWWIASNVFSWFLWYVQQKTSFHLRIPRSKYWVLFFSVLTSDIILLDWRLMMFS